MLCIIDEVTNYLITVPIYHSRSEEIGDALKENLVSEYCIPDYLIMGQDGMFMSSLMNYLLKILMQKLRQQHLRIISLYKQNMEKINVYNTNYTFDRFRSDVAKIFTISNLGL